MDDKKIFITSISYFFSWRMLLFLIAFLATLVITKFGGRFPYADRVLSVTNLPGWIWGFGGFDGVHYLRIAQDGYKASAYSSAFFPVFPLLIRFFSNFLPKNPFLDTRIFVDPVFFYSGIVLANLFFLAALYFLYKLFRLDYDSKTSWLSILFLLLFPTSFYFGSIYTESLFLLLATLVLYESRRRNFLLAGIFCAVASATRAVGIFLALVILIELYSAIGQKEISIKGRKFFSSLFGLLISPVGLLMYMFYLWREFDDPLYFASVQPYFGAQRSSSIILLPQVFYRYIKIFLSVPIFSLQFFNSFLEFVFALGAIILLVLYFKKIRFSYWIFVFFALITPTLTGSFSSMPRYCLAAFPLLPILVDKLGKYRKLAMTLSAILGILLLSLFIRGYWVA